MGLAPTLAPPDVKDVTLSLFGGRKTDIAPSDCPEGLTPDEQDNVFLPGNVQSRPGMARLYAAGKLTAGTAVLYEKTYVQPNGNPLTLALTSDGKLWVEDIVNNPRNPTQPFSVAPGLYAQSVTEFGREYIAFSDLLHGQGVPLQFDGLNFDRVTQDGPGAPPVLADEEISGAIDTLANGGLSEYAPNIQSGTESGNAITISFQIVGDTAAGFALVAAINSGNQIQAQVSGVGTAGYNGTYAIASAFTEDGINIDVTFISSVAGLAPVGAGGTIELGFARVVPVTPFDVTFRLGMVAIVSSAGVSGYNGTFTVAGQNAGGTHIYLVNPTFGLANSGSGTLTVGGNISVGIHQAVVMFLTRQGAITRPSPATHWTAGGTHRVIAGNLPIGPENVVARIIAFTGAGGDNFFFIPTTANLPGSPTVFATIVPDNTSTTATFDFSDNALFDAIAIDQVGNDLFDQRVLGPVLGFFAYASRLSCWGGYNKIENWLNMGFCGGFLLGVLTAPLGWNSGLNSGGTLVNGGPWAAGMSWQITGDGSASHLGLLSQSALEDSFGDAIISPNTQYSARLWAKSSAPGLNGNFFLVLSSASTGFSSTALFAINTFSITGAFTPLVEFSLATPDVIPDDLSLSLYEANLNNGATVTVSELAIIFTENPFRNNLSDWSYVNNPEAFAETTGELGPDDDASPIRCFALLRQSSVLATAEGIHTFSDNDSEPGDWNVNQLTRSLGALSLRAMDPGKFGTGDGAEDWLMVADRKGPYLFAGADFWKISQEISRGTLPIAQDPRRTWNDNNWAATQTVVTKNDPEQRRAYFAVPLQGVNGAPDAATPNGLFVLDYREMDTATQIAGAPPLHITITGKMRSSDLTRKWSFWNVACNDMQILERPGNAQDLFFASGAFPGGAAFGNIYSLDPAKLSDEDYGAIVPYYTTYAFTDHEQEQALQLGADSKLVRAVHAFIAGLGTIAITPIVNSLYNFFPALSPRLLALDINTANFQAYDLEWMMAGLRGQRLFFRISVSPLPGSTDVQYRVQKFIVHMMKDPVMVSRQSGI